jgi:hypothetical protein
METLLHFRVRKKPHKSAIIDAMKISAVNVYFVRPRWGFVEIVTDGCSCYSSTGARSFSAYEPQTGKQITTVEWEIRK